ncbi:hypothetical protein ACHQM5_000339 [Ranunculus cassubicifolius]
MEEEAAINEELHQQLRGKNIIIDDPSHGEQVISDNLVYTNYTVVEPQLTNPDDDIDLVEELTFNTNVGDLVVGSSGNSDSRVRVREGMTVASAGVVREQMAASSGVVRQGHWNRFFKLPGVAGGSSQREHGSNKGKEQESRVNSEFGSSRTLQQSNLQQSSDIARVLGNNSENNLETSPGGIRTKLLCSSGFPQFLLRNSLKGKGVVHKYAENREEISVIGKGKSNEKPSCAGKAETSLDMGVKIDHSSVHSVGGARSVSMTTDGVYLREWLRPRRKVDRDESLRIFKQIVELVYVAHSRRVALQYIRPSCFKLLPSNHVKFAGLFTERETCEKVTDTDVTSMAHHPSRKRLMKEGLPTSNVSNSKHQKGIKKMNTHQYHPTYGSGFTFEAVKEVDICNSGSQDSGYSTSQRHNSSSDYQMQNRFGSPLVLNTTQNKFIAANLSLEETWYASPEEQNKREHTFSSDIYCLGVLLFELFCSYESWDVHTAAMLDLRYRILPPTFLSEYPKEAGFCLWLLHPEPSSRPKVREILQSELICGIHEVTQSQLQLPDEEDEMESEILLHFLSSLKELKNKHASKLVEEIGGIEADIEEVRKRYLIRTDEVLSKDLSSMREALSKEPAPPQARLTENIKQLEIAYFSMRSQIQLPDADRASRLDKDLLKNREIWLKKKNENEGDKNSTDYLGSFFDGLCKYARCTKFELRGTLRSSDFVNSSNVICSLSFDRDGEYFAAARISKKIKIFEFNRLLNDSSDIHYPVVEMTSKSRLSCVCWNKYIKNYLAATAYDGAIQLWDASTGQGISQYTGHEKRAWSVDFSPFDPTKLASGSDDCSVKLWSTKERKCTTTIRSSANVCCVQFSTDSPHLLAFGSADFKTYLYDLRNTRIPWCTLSGHGKAVSYVKFLDAETLVSTSTDNTLKLWDLNKTTSTGFSTNACSLTYRGHTNEKNFVGLSVSDGYIACGSESNEVYAYHRSLPMPITSHKFGSMDSVSGQDNGEDNGEFVSSVCWKGKSDMLLAANSTGSIKLLQIM